MATYVIALRRDAVLQGETLAERVSQIRDITVTGDGSPRRLVVEATTAAADELARRFGHEMLVEPEVRHARAP